MQVRDFPFDEQLCTLIFHLYYYGPELVRSTCESCLNWNADTRAIDAHDLMPLSAGGAEAFGIRGALLRDGQRRMACPPHH